MRFSLNHVRLRDKMLIVYLVCVLIPIVLTDFVFYQVTTHHVKQQKLNDISMAMEQIRRDFLEQMDVAAGISSILYTDGKLNETIEKPYDGASEYVDSYYSDISPTLFRYSPIYKSVSNITIYTDNPTIIGGGGVLPISEEVEATPWYRALEMPGRRAPVVVRNDVETSRGLETVYSFVRKLDYFQSQYARHSVVKIDISYDAVASLFRNSTLQGDLYLVNDLELIDYASGSALDWQHRSLAYASHASPSDGIAVTKSIENVDYLKGWRIEGVFPEHRVLQDVYKSRNFVVYLALPNLLIPTLIIIWFTRSLGVRIVRILKHMKRVRNHHFDTIKHPDHRDEIGQLTNEFNRMTIQIKNLIDDVYVADIQRKDLEIKRNQAQLHALQSQINPHFLFNALETIRMRSIIKKEEETAKIIHNMAKIFRRSLSWDKDWMTVREELELVHCFLEIQKYRFGDKLMYEIDVEDEAMEWLIPKMSILPFVENASIHGIEPSKNGGLIRLAIRAEGRQLIAEIEDNGAGIPEEEVGAIERMLEREEPFGEHVGIQNVYRRLQLYYRDRFTFKLDSEWQRGTAIRIAFPREPEERSA
ncbi:MULTISPECIES: sensor histidine kinase [unclassified Paenibacillus]|uniref:sensor histidine kinase n=1 Tax=unclassified Paenibacillus TaxID=185978 RepID=UPI000957250C|nr:MULTISPECIES: sensor histidine kinase [unclassified Paenibacillus]ASS64955.1 sensor histidine kinase [Paenibacillus sp. RUD330]SIR00124.1 two-component system, sensor histidine kinase YesM [Paenibacillus sp. RU4X]SIR34693.1 two-component system, sensor histidine kinase YesM [Paenibacillus sp. RU4T]